MKKYRLLYFLVLISFSCFVNKRLSQEYSDKEVIENLKHVTSFPDDYFFPKGDSICEKILKRGKSIIPLLIAKIDDTSNSDYIYAGVLQYKVGDIAINLIDNLYDNSELPLRKLLVDEFFKKNTDDYQYIMLYDFVFFNNTEKENLENRKRFKKIISKWYNERIK